MKLYLKTICFAVVISSTAYATPTWQNYNKSENISKLTKQQQYVT